jgi:purine-binding chemotaxis protein CheW
MPLASEAGAEIGRQHGPEVEVEFAILCECLVVPVTVRCEREKRVESPAVDAPERPEPARPARAEPAKKDPLDEFFFRSDERLGDEVDLPDQEPVEVAAPEEPLKEYLAFRLAEEIFAIELDCVREIAKVPPVTEVPRAPAYILGVMNLRGEVMPVFDLHKRFGLIRQAPCSRGSRVVVVETAQGPAGLLVEAVEQVVKLPPSSIETPPPGLGAGVDSDHLVGIGRHKDRMFALLNLASVLALPPAKGKR